MGIQDAYQNFTKKLIMRRRDSYRRVFLDDRGNLTPDAEVVIADLIRFCNIRKSSIRLDNNGTVDLGATVTGEGRREVFNRLNSYLYIDEKIIQNLNETE